METIGLTALSIAIAVILGKVVPAARHGVATTVLCVVLALLVLPGVVLQTASWRVDHYPALTTEHERDVAQQIRTVQDSIDKISAYK